MPSWHVQTEFEKAVRAAIMRAAERYEFVTTCCGEQGIRKLFETSAVNTSRRRLEWCEQQVLLLGFMPVSVQ